MVDLARYDDRIRVHADMLDNQPYALNTPDGTIDLHTATLHPHQAADNHTKITGSATNPTNPPPVDLIPDRDVQRRPRHDRLPATHPRLRRHRRRHPPHPAVPPRSRSQRKTVLTDVLLAVLGDYAITLPSHVLIADKYSHDTELARLAGARVAVCSEVTENGKFDEER